VFVSKLAMRSWQQNGVVVEVSDCLPVPVSYSAFSPLQSLVIQLIVFVYRVPCFGRWRHWMQAVTCVVPNGAAFDWQKCG